MECCPSEITPRIGTPSSISCTSQSRAARSASQALNRLRARRISPERQSRHTQRTGVRQRLAVTHQEQESPAPVPFIAPFIGPDQKASGPPVLHNAEADA